MDALRTIQHLYILECSTLGIPGAFLSYREEAAESSVHSHDQHPMCEASFFKKIHSSRDAVFVV